MLLEALWHPERQRRSQKHPSQQLASSASEGLKQRARNRLEVRGWLLIALQTLLSVLSSSYALRMTNLDLPQMALQGDTIELSCAFTLDSSTSLPLSRLKRESRASKAVVARDLHRALNDDEEANATNDKTPALTAAFTTTSQPAESLYAIKWYKDEREFFRYLAQDWPHKQALPLGGVQVDVEKSGNHTVTLKNISLKTSGTYKCEVSTDAPTFVTKSIERNMLVYTFFSEGPTIENIRGHKPVASISTQMIGDQIELRCSARDSKPVAQLDWIINDKLNLSASNLMLATNQKLLFSVDQRRHVRLPIQNTNLPPEPLAQAKDAPKATTLYQTYELVDIADTITAKPLANSSRPISLTSKSLDQLVEFATSTLNFTVSPDLIRLLYERAQTSGESSRRSIAKLLLGHARLERHGANLPSSPIEINGRSDNYTQGTNGVPSKRRGSSSSQMTSPRTNSSQSKFILKIKCVARVMHLSMSDELKIRFINKTRENIAQELVTLGEPLSQNPLERNSSLGKCGLHLGMILVSLIINFTGVGYHRILN